jgi:hypothetical protein
VPAELSGRPKVDFATDHLRKLHLHANQAEVSRAQTFSNSTSRSTSLSSRNRSVRIDPNKDNFRM